MISIMTTMILIIVISLIVLGFASLSRRNQREALDRQLSTQAFYAAESGVNDARARITQAINANATVPEKTTCTGTASGFYTASPDIDAAANVRYSCLLVDPSPTVLRYGDVGTNSVVIPLTASSGTFSRIQLDWQSKVSGNPLSGCPGTVNAFTTTGGWSCGYGVLRFDLVRTDGTFGASDLQNNRTMTTFAVPVTGGTTSIPFAAGTANGNVRAGTTCTTDGCRLSVSGLTSSSYYLRVSSVYRNVSMQVRGFNSLNNAIEIQGAQATIDATGRAQDVLRRIQVSVPLSADSQNQVSDYALQSTDSICKRYSVMDDYFDNDVSGITSTNRLCQP
jgi:Tfp pilus assembly protein PilX